MQAEYLKACVGSALSDGIAQTVLMRPDDPIDYLAQYLLKSVADKEGAEQLQKEIQAEQQAVQQRTESTNAEQAEKDRKLAQERAQLSKEDSEFAAGLSAASSLDEVCNAAASYIRTRIGVSSYVAVTDLPEQEPVAKTDAAEAAAVEPAEGEPEEGERGEEQADEGEEAPSKPKFVPQTLKYVFATGTDERLLVGKQLLRPKAATEDDEEGAAPVRGVGEGVSFDSIDAFLAGTQTILHVPSAIQNKSVKFFYIPRTGALAVAPFANADGEVKGVFSADALGTGRKFTDEELAILEKTAKEVGLALDRVESALGEYHLKATAELTAAYEEKRADLATELEEAATIEADEGGDKLASLKAKWRRAAADLGALSDDKLTFLFSRQSVTPEVLSVLKAVQAIVSPALRPRLANLDWDGFKACCKDGKAAWGTQLFSVMGALDVMESSDADGFATAAAMVPADVDSDSLKSKSFVSFLMLQWVRDATALFEQKLAKQKAEEAAAAAAAADAAATEADTEEAQEGGES